ncbi:MAG TPA: dTDP-4-dehydrorhamnose reductase [Alphaproteobacteria bacterium]|nr:dTDP-4-dehydrorhamnose reductase [Alphaproteobacteria bacterium]HNS44226.1 dTDP-4-dehydrorhamnose reductase [Alphaproteobacteria bacterium]
MPQNAGNQPEILLLGACGMLGSEFRDALGADRIYVPTSSEADITNLNALRYYCENKETIRTIINCVSAGTTELLEDHLDLASKVNVEGARNVAKLARELGAALIHFSTDYVFDGKKGTPYTETDPVNPLSVYAKSKLESEQVVMDEADTVLCFRTAWLFSHHGKNFVKTILSLVQEQREIAVVNDQIGAPTYARDLARHVMDILPHIKSGQKEIYHLTNAGVATWCDLACATLEQIVSPCNVRPITSGEFPQKAKRPTYSVLDLRKIKRDFGIIPRPWREALRECLSLCDRDAGIKRS